MKTKQTPFKEAVGKQVKFVLLFKGQDILHPNASMYS